MHFDVYFAEQDLHDRDELSAALARLRQSGHVYEAEGATWVRTTDSGDDKDRVYIRANGDFTYFAADCAYYLDKRRRGFGKIIIILGADHHGYVGRLRAIAGCFGDDPDQTLEVLIGQLVNLVRDGQPVRMSKRAGTVVSDRRHRRRHRRGRGPLRAGQVLARLSHRPRPRSVDPAQ